MRHLNLLLCIKVKQTEVMIFILRFFMSEIVALFFEALHLIPDLINISNKNHCKVISFNT